MSRGGARSVLGVGMHQMPVGRGLVGAAEGEETILLEVAADELEADRASIGVEAAA